MSKPFQGFNHGTSQIVFGPEREFAFPAELKPIEVHIKQDGSITDEPSLCFVMVDGAGAHRFAQISLDMLNDGLADIGYKLLRKDQIIAAWAK